MSDAYYEGVAAHPFRDCPYSYALQLYEYCQWMAGFNDADRDLA